MVRGAEEIALNRGSSRAEAVHATAYLLLREARDQGFESVFLQRRVDREFAARATSKGRAKEVMDRQSDRLPRQARCEGMRIEREIQMGASGGGQSIKASGHWPREQAGHKPATDMTVRRQKRP